MNRGLAYGPVWAGLSQPSTNKLWPNGCVPFIERHPWAMPVPGTIVVVVVVEMVVSTVVVSGGELNKG